MNYSVDWTDDALVMLSAVWIPSPNRQGVTAAQVEIDRLLAADPYGNSTPVSEGLYAIEVHPLRALFEISEDDRLLTVVSVRELA